MESTHIQIETTFANEDDAKNMARQLLSTALVACCHIAPVESLYTFEGKQHEETEYVLKAKTKAELYKDCEKFIKNNHPYKVPQITKSAVSGNQTYFNWVDQSTKKS